jgi:hypothetical protein
MHTHIQTYIQKYIGTCIQIYIHAYTYRQGFEAADFVLGGYWVWGKLIENLADIGYVPEFMF